MISYMADPGIPRRGAPTPEEGTLTFFYFFAKKLPKLHENERNWTGGCP